MVITKMIMDLSNKMGIQSKQVMKLANPEI
jgi:hypothetical protein